MIIIMKEYNNNDDRMNFHTCTLLLCAAIALSMSQACTHFIVPTAQGEWEIIRDYDPVLLQGERSQHREGT